MRSVSRALSVRAVVGGGIPGGSAERRRAIAGLRVPLAAPERAPDARRHRSSLGAGS